jgi:alkylation response protein AidB-like acyl-CoA dehydrogenase
MTELTGGSDVGISQTIAKRDPQITRSDEQGGGTEESGRNWLLYGRKWFTSAITSQMALTLARPEGNPPGGRGLALFYLELAMQMAACRTFALNDSRINSARAEYRPQN